MAKYKNKYRIESIRAQWWDYGWNGAYFITICTKNRAHYFGEISGGKMKLSQVGIIADIFWHLIPDRLPIVELGDFVVMPNHIHGIFILNKPAVEIVGPLHAKAPQPQPEKNQQMAAISPKSNSVSTIIRSYKSAVTKHANPMGNPNGWQSCFHDHIIRNNAEYERISNYIINNPTNWKEDNFWGL